MAQQYGALRIHYPRFETKLFGDHVSTVGKIKPTSRSVTYTFKLNYRLRERPKISIVSPVLEQNFNGDDIPHVHPEKEPCLYYPKFEEFNSTKLIAECIIPWMSLWLYHYENWHITGNWEGGGIHPEITRKKGAKKG